MHSDLGNVLNRLRGHEGASTDFHVGDTTKEHALNTNLGKLRWKNCETNPGHKDFIPVKEFGLNHLPEGHRNETILKRIKCLADLTCRLTVCKKSSNRPKDNTLFCDVGEQRMATGTVIEIVKTKLAKTKQCEHCRGSHTFSKGFHVIRIMTACHVVFDCEEAENTTIDLFYDDEIDTEGIQRLEGFRVKSRNIDLDQCVFECTTKDVKLVNLLEEKLITFNNLTKSSPSAGTVPCEIIASHPHGLSKHISVGVSKHINVGVSKDKHDLTLTGNSGHFHRKFPMKCYEDKVEISLFLSTDSIIVSNKPVSEFAGIQCDVFFPDSTTQKCHLWKWDEEVRSTKAFLIGEAGIHEDPNNFYLELMLPNEASQIMRDDNYLEYYKDDVTSAFCIYVKRLD
ncbi:unnamed protein product [Lymnaea stagnalis]|uniref:Peptidase S1 domain-containing protein n=1 Tax=Lymnaea stagnalis TaxID=6523 RepID=A0AAV2I8A1_LYMST